MQLHNTSTLESVFKSTLNRKNVVKHDYICLPQGLAFAYTWLPELTQGFGDQSSQRVAEKRKKTLVK